MDATVTSAVITKREPGNLPEAQVHYYQDDKPAPTILSTQVVQFLRYKTDTKAKTKRENMAVVCTKLDADDFSGVTGHALLNELLSDLQLDILLNVADKNATFEDANEVEKIIAWFNDNSRQSNGWKVSREVIIEFCIEKFGPYIIRAALAKNAQMKDETVERVVKNYAEMFSKLTKYNLVEAFTEPQLVLVKRIMNECAEHKDEDMYQWMQERITKLDSARKAQDELLEAI